MGIPSKRSRGLVEGLTCRRRRDAARCRYFTDPRAPSINFARPWSHVASAFLGDGNRPAVKAASRLVAPKPASIIFDGSKQVPSTYLASRFRFIHVIDAPALVQAGILLLDPKKVPKAALLVDCGGAFFLQ